jgi:polygalacturonase
MDLAKVVTYPFYPSIHQLSDTYQVTVNGVNVPVTQYQQCDYAYFSMQGPVNITIAKIKFNDVGSYSISPQNLGLKATITGNHIDFTLRAPQYLIVKLDSRQELVLMADPLENTDEYVDINDPSVRLITSRDYPADKTGNDYAHGAIQSAINNVTQNGGGIVYIPPGIYKTGNIILKSNVHLYLAGGAILRYTGAQDIYQPWFSKNGRNFTYWIRSDFNSSNIKITGRGMIDADGHSTYSDPKNLGVTILAPMRTENFFFSGPILKEASFWCTIVMYSKNVRMTNLKTLDRFDMGENDGIDIVESSDVTVSRAIAISWDDPFSTKTYDPGQPGGFENFHGPGQITENILFEDLVSWTGLYGVKLGQGFAQLQRNVIFRNVVIYDCSCAIGIDHKYGTGAGSDIIFENIDVERVTWTVIGRRTWLALFDEDGNSDGKVGTFGNVTVRNITLRDMGVSGGEIRGWNGTVQVGKVILENIFPVSLGRAAKSLKEMGITKVDYAPDIEVISSN